MNEKTLKTLQLYMSKVPLIIIGSGASVPYGIPGMWDLGQHLKKSSLPDNCKDYQHQKCWDDFLQLIEKTDLESSLTKISATNEITNHIVKTTWQYLNEYDLKIFEKVIVDRDILALSNLYKFLFKSNNPEINVITPNYDRIAEYAAEVCDFATYTGFNYGSISRKNNHKQPKISINKQQIRTVNVWKVHGSFSWFLDQNNLVLSLPPRHEIPSDFKPLIVTPGIEKYRTTYQEPFTTIAHFANESVNKAKAFLCIGYGFNDEHLQTKLLDRCNTEKIPLILITKVITDQAKELLSKGHCKNYIAIEELDKTHGGIRIYSNEEPDGIEYSNDDSYWSLDKFLELLQ